MEIVTSDSSRAHEVRRSVSPVQHFIDGHFRPSASGRTFDTVSPADNLPITQVAAGDSADIDLAVQAARRAFDDGPWPRMSTRERADILRNIASAIERRGDRIAEVETLDTGLPITQAKGQAARAAENFRFFASVIESMHGESYPVGANFLNYSVTKPAGVAGLITPWNTPFMLETWKVAPCLAAGDTCVLKPAEWSPLSADQLAEVMLEVGLPDGVFNIVHGTGEQAGAPLVAHPGVNLISFTGETSTGREIIRNGAAGLKRYSMELGGKSPIVVFGDSDVERAIDAAVFGVFSLNGERCTASSRLLVQSELYPEFIDAVAERTSAIRIGDPFDPKTELGPLIHADHRQRVQSYVDLGRAEGATVRAGGDVPTSLAEGNYVPATLFADVTPSMRVFQEEIFGPVLVATEFADERAAVQLANQVQYGLAAYVWTRDAGRAHRVAQAIDAGMTWINSQNVRDLRTPFGGMKQSGIGREGGTFSFEFFCETKTVHVALGEHPIPRFGVT